MPEARRTVTEMDAQIAAYEKVASDKIHLTTIRLVP
jgi:hypothetical protein